MRRSMRRRDLLRAAGIFVIGGFPEAAPLSAPRRLKLKNANTRETFQGTYRDEAGPIPEAMADLGALLRDHYVNKIGPLDITKLDFLSHVMAAARHGTALVL